MRSTIFLLLSLLSHFAFAQTEPVKLQWVNIPYATSYEIEVESSGTQGRPLIVRTIAIPEVAVDLPPGSYVYRVRGIAANEKGPWSEKQPFEVKPEAVALLTPATELKVEAGTVVRFNWKASSGYRYRIQIVNSKGVVSDRETPDAFFEWTAPVAGLYGWKVAYANIGEPVWSERRTVRVQPAKRNSPAALAALKMERPKSRWTKTFWAGADMNSYKGDFADTGNDVSASTLSGDYSFVSERRHDRFSAFGESRPSIRAGITQQSLIKKTAWLPELSGKYSYLWNRGYLKFGPLVEGTYGQTGFFTADALGNYKTSAFWRSTYSAGLHGEYLFRKFVLTSFAKFGASSGGNSDLAPGGVQPSTIVEAGIGGKLLKASKWSLMARFYNEDVKWKSAVGNNSLSSTNWSLALGGEL